MDGPKDPMPASPAPETPADAWLLRRERLASLIHGLRITAPLLHHRVQKDGGPGAVELDDGCELVVAGLPSALIVRLTAPEWCSEAESRRLAIIAAVSVAARPGWSTLQTGGRRTDLVISLSEPDTP